MGLAGGPERARRNVSYPTRFAGPMAPARRVVRPARGREDRGAAREPKGRPIASAILDAAFHRAHGASPHGARGPDRNRRRALLKIVRSSAVVRRHLRLRAAPLDDRALTEFQARLLDRSFGAGSRARTLRRLGVAERRIEGLSREAQRELPRIEKSEELAALVRRLYGRMASHLHEVEPDLERLEAMQRFVKSRPRLDPATPTVVVAGFPNVGKSSLVARLSTARPKVAAYPFTTLALEVGHADLGLDRSQILDTPGVLGRSRANPAETEALTAVGHAATIVLFVIDPTGSGGYTLAEQEGLLARWRTEFPTTEILEVETKSDLAGPRTGRFQVSAKTGAGLEELRQALQAAIARHAPRGELPPMEESLVADAEDDVG